MCSLHAGKLDAVAVFVRVSQDEVPAWHEDGMFHTSCIYIQIAWIPLMGFGLVGRAKSTGN